MKYKEGMIKIIKRFLITQSLSILYAFITITVIEVAVRVEVLQVFILLEIILTGLLCNLLNRKLLDNWWGNTLLISIPYMFYSILVLGAYGVFFPFTGAEDDYSLGFVVIIGIVGSWISIVIAMLSNNITRGRDWK